MPRLTLTPTRTVLYVTGAPEQIFRWRRWMLRHWIMASPGWGIAARGQRVLAFAVKPLPDATLPLQPGSLTAPCACWGWSG